MSKGERVSARGQQQAVAPRTSERDVDGAETALSHIRTQSRRDDETTLPRMTGDAGLLMSTTTSESEKCATT